MNDIQNNPLDTCNQLSTWLRLNSWEQKTNSHYIFRSEISEAYISVRLNLVTNEHMTTTFIKGKGELPESESHFLPFTNTRVAIETEIERLTEYENEFSEIESYQKELLRFLDSRFSSFNVNKEAYKFTLKNGLTCYVHFSKEEELFEYTILQNGNPSLISNHHHGYHYFFRHHLDMFYSYIKEIEKRIPTRTGWINPFDEDAPEYQKSVSSFEKESNSIQQEAKKLRDIASNIFPEDWLFYLFFPRYSKGVFSLDFTYGTKAILLVSKNEALQSLLQQLSGTTADSIKNINNIKIKETDEQSFITYCQELYNQIYPILQNYQQSKLNEQF